MKLFTMCIRGVLALNVLMYNCQKSLLLFCDISPSPALEKLPFYRDIHGQGGGLCTKKASLPGPPSVLYCSVYVWREAFFYKTKILLRLTRASAHTVPHSLDPAYRLFLLLRSPFGGILPYVQRGISVLSVLTWKKKRNGSFCVFFPVCRLLHANNEQTKAQVKLHGNVNGAIP